MKTHSYIAALCLALALTACAAPTPTTAPQPTQDSAMLVESAVETVMARLTADAASRPSATPQPSATPAPTATTAPPTPESSPEPSPSPSATQQVVSARLAYVSTFPENKREYLPNEMFSVALGFENTGSIAWGPGYEIRLVNFEGEATVQLVSAHDEGVPAGERVEFSVWGFGSETPGQHTWYFQVFSPEGVAVPGGFGSFTYTALPS